MGPKTYSFKIGFHLLRLRMDVESLSMNIKETWLNQISRYCVLCHGILLGGNPPLMARLEPCLFNWVDQTCQLAPCQIHWVILWFQLDPCVNFAVSMQACQMFPLIVGSSRFLKGDQWREGKVAALISMISFTLIGHCFLYSFWQKILARLKNYLAIHFNLSRDLRIIC